MAPEQNHSVQIVRFKKVLKYDISLFSLCGRTRRFGHITRLSRQFMLILSILFLWFI